MNEQLKKKLTSNWFKILHESICKDIEKLEVFAGGGILQLTF